MIETTLTCLPLDSTTLLFGAPLQAFVRELLSTDLPFGGINCVEVCFILVMSVFDAPCRGEPDGVFACGLALMGLSVSSHFSTFRGNLPPPGVCCSQTTCDVEQAFSLAIVR